MFRALFHIIDNWKTSLVGTGLAATIFTVLQGGCGAKSWKSWALAVAVAGLGLIAKDPGKTAH